MHLYGKMSHFRSFITFAEHNLEINSSADTQNTHSIPYKYKNERFDDCSAHGQTIMISKKQKAVCHLYNVQTYR